MTFYERQDIVSLKLWKFVYTVYKVAAVLKMECLDFSLKHLIGKLFCIYKKTNKTGCLHFMKYYHEVKYWVNS